MAYGRYKRFKRYGRRSYAPGLHGQRKHRPTARGRFARRVARRTFIKDIRMPKRILARKDANTVGQIAYREFPRRRPMHGGRRKFGRRSYRRY